MPPKQQTPIANRVREFRVRADLTQEALGEKVGVTRVTINCLENGVYLPSIELAFKLARFFKLRVDELFSLEDE